MPLALNFINHKYSPFSLCIYRKMSNFAHIIYLDVIFLDERNYKDSIIA